MIEAYPLYWPEGRIRTPQHKRERARFETGFARARDEVVRQIEMMTGRYEWMRREANIIMSTNVALRRDGLPLAGQRAPTDLGVAVYFTYKKRQMCFACDRWDKIEDNMQAIAKTIEALRGVARWGTGDMMEAAFTGFAALPAPGQARARSWREVLGFDPHITVTEDMIDDKYRRLASVHHPDKGGTTEAFQELGAARTQARASIGY